MFKKKTLIMLAFSMCMANLTGCASVMNGTTQSISVKTGQIQDATCALENNKGKWYVNRTPGSVTVHRSYNDLSIECKKKGYLISNTKVASKTKPQAFGNILVGGAIGAAVDVADGAAYGYPAEIDVPLAKA